MNTVLLVSPDERLRNRLLGGLDDCSVFVAQGDAEALRTLRLVDIDLVIRDTVSIPRDLDVFTQQVREVAPGGLVVAIGPVGDHDPADFRLPADFQPREWSTTLRQADEKLRLLREIARLRQPSGTAVRTTAPETDDEWDSAALGRVLTEFARAFAAGFDLPRALEMFLDAIGELVRPTRTALLLPDPGAIEYRVATHRGLAPQIVHSVRLSGNSGLAHWLATQARPARIHDLTEPEVLKELKLLQGVLAVPLLAHGELVAILVVGQPVFASTYGRRDTETLFDLATQLATAIRDITLHHQIAREKEFNEKILEHMSSGVITIGRDHRVGTMNSRAEEILALTARDVIGHDLRSLPSPLGDMLYESLHSGRTVTRSELQLPLRNLSLEVSTYPVRGESSLPLGAVLVFEDVTAQKELLAQKSQAEQTQLLTRVVARIADEIKNPLVSINTFIELIGERYDDPDFRKHFAAVVRRDVRRLVDVFEKLAGLVSESESSPITVDVHTVIDDVVAAIELSDESFGKPLQIDVERGPMPQHVKVDPTQLRRAVSYLVWYLTHSSPPNQARISVSITPHAETNGRESVWILIGARNAAVQPDQLLRIFDPVEMVQESLIDVGPAVSQRFVEAMGGKLGLRHGRNDLSFLIALPTVAP